MRNVQEIKERVQLAIIEEINNSQLMNQKEPENYIPTFITNLANKITEITLDEIAFRRRY